MLNVTFVAVFAFAGHSDSIPNSASGPQLGFAAATGIATVIPLMMFAFAAKRVPLTIIGPLQYLVPSINFDEQKQFREGTQAAELIDYFAKHFGTKTS